ncbi:MAG: hypothetical protein ACTIJ8_14750 [Sphingobacterium sp.]
MIKSIFIVFSLLALSFFACEKTGEKNQNADREALDKLKQQIEAMVQGVPCTDPAQWSIAALGNKACGGAMSYIAYPSTIDTEEFLALIERYTRGEDEFNAKYNIISDCMAIPAPQDVRCEDGKPVFIYQTP